MAFDQQNRTYRLKCTDSFPGASDPAFRKMDAYERLSTPFEFRVLSLLERPGDSPDQDLSRMLGQGFSVGIYDDGVSQRFFHGCCAEARYVGTERGGHLIELVLRPAFWFSTRNTQSRVFHDQTVEQIVGEVLNQNPRPEIKIKMRVGDPTKKRLYCVQYDETDFNFVSRLLEEEGLFYYFAHAEGGHEMIITDDGRGDMRKHDDMGDVSFFPRGATQQRGAPHLDEWHIRAGVEHADSVHAIGYNYEKRETFGGGGGGPQLSEAVFISTREYFPVGKTKSEAEHYGKIWAEAEHALRLTREGAGSEIRLRPGDVFKLNGHGVERENRRYAVVETRHKLVSDAYHSGDSVEARPVSAMKLTVIPDDVRFRPRRTTPRPRIAGPQTAIVAAYDEAATEEIAVDELGRVRVNFMWGDSAWARGIRHGKLSETSCWVRVAQIWAGKGWGALFTPRVGQEVIVEFEGGDPDRPIITGSVYNGQYGVPYPLPAHKTRSTIKSESSKGGGGFNEIRFEDKKGKEEFFMHAQLNMTVRILNDLDTHIGHNEKRVIHKTRTTTIEKGDELLDVITGNREVVIEKGNDSLTLPLGNQTIEISAGSQDTKAFTSIKLAVGNNSIEITPLGITLKGVMIMIDGTMTTVKGNAVLNLTSNGLNVMRGAPIMQN